MHLKLDSSGSIDDGDVARDLGQAPADIVVLSAADSDLAAFGAAYATLSTDFPSVRLTNLLALGHPASVDLYVERTLCRARIVVQGVGGRVDLAFARPDVKQAEHLVVIGLKGFDGDAARRALQG